MSVLARNRSISKLKFYVNAKNIHVKLMDLCQRDFGVKMIRNIVIHKNRMEPEDAETLANLAEKYYGTPKLPAKYPERIVEKYFNTIWDISTAMLHNVICAYTLWPTCKAEAEERRIYQDRAIASCEVLIVELELASRELDVSADKYKQYIAMLDEEVGLLKGWRKSDNKKFKDLK